MALHLDFPAWIVYPYLFIIGAIVGSFLNVCIYRIADAHLSGPIPVGGFWKRFFAAFKQTAVELRSLADRPSHCPRCKQNIRWYDNVPILGWLKLRGRCRNCRMRISPRYPLIEFLNALLWVVVFWMEVPLGWHATLSESCLHTELGPQVVPGLGFLSPTAFVICRYLYHMVLIEALLVASFIDLDHRVIPDGTTLPAMFMGLLGSTVLGRLHLLPVWFQSPRLLQTFGIITPEWLHPWMDGPAIPEWIAAHPHLHGFVVSLVGLIVGGGMVWGVRIIGAWLLKREAMGFGDVILMAMIGSFLGWQATVIAFFVGGMTAVVLVLPTYFFREDPEIPYGPFLSLGAIITILCWSSLFDRFERVLNLGVLIFFYAAFMVVGFIVSLFVVQAVKRALGWETPEPLPGRWTAGDQNWFFAGEKVDRHTGLWRRQDWEGIAAARGQIHEQRWRYGQTSSSGWRRHRTL